MDDPNKPATSQVKADSDHEGERNKSVTPTPTPKKRGRKDQPRTPSKKQKSSAGDDATPSSGGSKMSVMLTKEAVNRALADPNLSSDDKTMLRMKELEGKTFKEITEYFENKHGKKYSQSTWKMRHVRLVPKLITVESSDLEKLPGLKLSVEAEIEDQKKALDKKKWALIADALVKSGGNKYPADTLEKAWKHKKSTDEDAE